MISRPEVLVIGGGPAGSATALLLALRGVDTVLIERDDFTTFRPGETLPPTVRPFLQRWHLWDRFLALGPVPCLGVEALWESDEPQVVDHLANPYGCGWHVDRRRFDQLLFDAAAQAGATARIQTRFGSLKPSSSGWQVALIVESKELEAEPLFIVDATGRRAAVARQLGRRRHAFDDRLAICAVIEGRCIPTLLVEATEYGWWSSAALSSRSVSLTYVTAASGLRLRGCNPFEAFTTELLQAPRTTARVSPVKSSYMGAVAASSSCLDSAIGPRWLAVGDAASTFDPISGLGVVKAFREAEMAASAIVELLGSNERPLVSYRDAVHRRFAAYREQRDSQYRAVHRWPASPFWN